MSEQNEVSEREEIAEKFATVILTDGSSLDIDNVLGIHSRDAGALTISLTEERTIVFAKEHWGLAFTGMSVAEVQLMVKQFAHRRNWNKR